MYVFACLFFVGHVLVVCYKLHGEQQWERNLTEHHRDTIAHSSWCTHFNKIVATLIEQLASLIIEPVLWIRVDFK